jgi:hypothetical protein
MRCPVAVDSCATITRWRAGTCQPRSGRPPGWPPTGPRSSTGRARTCGLRRSRSRDCHGGQGFSVAVAVKLPGPEAGSQRRQDRRHQLAGSCPKSRSVCRPSRSAYCWPDVAPSSRLVTAATDRRFRPVELTPCQAVRGYPAQRHPRLAQGPGRNSAAGQSCPTGTSAHRMRQEPHTT